MRLEKYCYTAKDFKLDWFSGTGPGGQNRNKVQACLRLTHLPSGITVTAQRQRTRSGNLKEAFASLRDPLTRWIKAELNKENPSRVVSTETIRTYHFADNRVTDHASGMQIAAKELDKKFGNLIEARLKEKINKKLC